MISMRDVLNLINKNKNNRYIFESRIRVVRLPPKPLYKTPVHTLLCL